MNFHTFFDVLVIGWLALAIVTFASLFFVAVPYGRHTRAGWGPTIDNRLGWTIMEAPAALVFAASFASGERSSTVSALVFFALWEMHYVHRAFIYPLRLRGGERRMPLAVAGMAFLFNLVNASLNGYYLFDLCEGYPSERLGDPRFIIGLGLFVAGVVINRQADHTLRSLRRPGESGYKIPHGGLYRWVSCPNYLGEIIEWTGWAVMTWSLVGLSFAVWTAANLAPRAWAHHAWYRNSFAEYPPERRALLPGVW